MGDPLYMVFVHKMMPVHMPLQHHGGVAHVVKILLRISFLLVQQLFKCCCRLWRRVVSSKVKKSFFNLSLFGIRGDTFISFEFTVKLRVCTSPFCLKPHAGFFRVFMYGKFDLYLQ